MKYVPASLAHVESWGRYPKRPQTICYPAWNDEVQLGGEKYLAHAQGRSYGDVCLLSNGNLIGTSLLNRVIFFDRELGILRAEAGATIAQLLDLIVPAGWFFPVVPGTKFVSLGGALANDIHGKNHHCAGSFGCHVRCFELRRSSSDPLICSANSNSELFEATIAGLGLTGFISWIELQLKPIRSAFIEQESFTFENIDEFLEYSRNANAKHEYTAAWVDCVSEKKGRGVLFGGDHYLGDEFGLPQRYPSRTLFSMPCDAPGFLLNERSMRMFAATYFGKHKLDAGSALVNMDDFFFPLDKIAAWNRLYGRRGFVQFQCVVDRANSDVVLREIFELSCLSGLGSFLAVLKEFGTISSPGLLSFPRSGLTLCLDFPIILTKTFELMSNLERIVVSAGGAIYPAKDALMKPATFRASFPKINNFISKIDRNFSSDFWERVNQ